MSDLKVEVPVDPFRRAMNLVDAFLNAPVGANMEVRIGKGVVATRIQGTDYGVTADEARIVADILDDTRRKFPGKECVGMKSFAEALRYAADRALPQ